MTARARMIRPCAISSTKNGGMHERPRKIQRGGDVRRDPDSRPDAHARPGLSGPRPAAAIRAVRAVPDRGSVALRRSRSRLVLAEFFLQRTYGHAFRRAGALGDGQGYSERLGRHALAGWVRSPGLRPRFHQGSEGEPGFRADRRTSSRVGEIAWRDSKRLVGSLSHRLV